MGKKATDPVTGLTPEMETFCLEVIKSGRQSLAYTKAYPNHKLNPKTLTEKASKLARSGKIAARIEVLRAGVRESTGISLVDHLKTLAELREEARSAMNYGPAITAEMARGKVSGLYVDKSDINLNISAGQAVRLDKAVKAAEAK